MYIDFTVRTYKIGDGYMVDVYTGAGSRGYKYRSYEGLIEYSTVGEATSHGNDMIKQIVGTNSNFYNDEVKGFNVVYERWWE